MKMYSTTLPGCHPLCGTHIGIDAIVAFFDVIGRKMRGSHSTVGTLVMGVNGKIALGHHLGAEEDALDAFYAPLQHPAVRP